MRASSCPARRAASSMRASISTTERLLALDSSVDLDTVRANLASIPVICAGGPDAGPIGKLSARGALPLAHRTSQHHHPDVPCSHRALHEPGDLVEHLLNVMVRPVRPK